MAREVEKRPRRLYRWNPEAWAGPPPQSIRSSGWSRRPVLVLSSLDRGPAGLEWHLSISRNGEPADEPLCREILAEFDSADATEDLSADRDARALLGRPAMARHFILPVPKS